MLALLFYDGAVRCWGHNNYGQLGIGSTTNQNQPTSLNGYALGSEFTFFSGMAHILPFHAAGWAFEAEVISTLPPHLEWNNESMMLNIGADAQPGNITVDVEFSIPSGIITTQVDIELIEILDPGLTEYLRIRLGLGLSMTSIHKFRLRLNLEIRGPA